jgi:hypothetical protein
MTIKRLYAKFKISLRDISKKSFDERQEAKTNAKQCTFICRKLIHSQNSDLLIAPISRKKYIKNEKLGIFITMEDGEVTITNHTYSYFIKLSDTEWNKLKDFFKNEMELRAMHMEKEMEYQIRHSLDTIYTKISTELITQK